MINIRSAKEFCKDFEKIENYDKAIADTIQTWHCHHRLGEIVSTSYLKSHNDYYNVSPNELIFLTASEHHKIHCKNMNNEWHQNLIKGINNQKSNSGRFQKGHKINLGRKHSEERRKQNSESHKGQISWNKGKPWSDKTKQKMSEAKKGKHWKLVDGKRVWY